MPRRKVGECLPLFIEQLLPQFAEAHRLTSGAFLAALSVHCCVTRLAAEHEDLPDYVASDIAGRANQLWQLTNVESVGRAYARVERELLASVTTTRSPYVIALEFSGRALSILTYGIDNENYVRDRTKPFTATSIKSNWPKLLAEMRDLQTPDDDLQEQMQIQVAKANQTSQLFDVNKARGQLSVPVAVNKGQLTGKRALNVSKRDKGIAKMFVDGKSHDEIVERYSKDGVGADNSRTIKSRLKRAISEQVAADATDDELQKAFGFRKDQSRDQIVKAFSIGPTKCDKT